MLQHGGCRSPSISKRPLAQLQAWVLVRYSRGFSPRLEPARPCSNQAEWQPQGGRADAQSMPAFRRARPIRRRRAARRRELVTKLFVAATLSSSPAHIGNTTSDDRARGLSVSLTMAAVSAPAALAIVL